MATISAQDIDLNGLDPNFVAAEAGGDAFNNGTAESYLVRVVNGAGVARTVTIAAQNNCNHGFSHDVALVTADGDDITVGPFDRERFNDPNGLVQITYSSEVGVTLAILNVTEAGVTA